MRRLCENTISRLNWLSPVYSSPTQYIGTILFYYFEAIYLNNKQAQKDLLCM